MIAEELKRLKCVFVADWPCHVEVEEIPLEVCRLCLEAKNNYANQQSKTVKRAIMRAEVPRPPSSEELLATLSNLDRRLLNDEVSIEEYLQGRNEIVKQLLACRGKTGVVAP